MHVDFTWKKLIFKNPFRSVRARYDLELRLARSSASYHNDEGVRWMANKNDQNQNGGSDRDTTNMDVNAGEAVGTAGGGVVGAAVGSVLGPIGTIAGGIAGAALGNKAGEAVGDEDSDSE